MNNSEKGPKRKELPPRVKLLLNNLKLGMTNEEVRQAEKKNAPYHINETFLKAYQNRFSGENAENLREEKPKPYRVYTTVLNMPPEDSES